jgi:hypothetical protein
MTMKTNKLEKVMLDNYYGVFDPLQTTVLALPTLRLCACVVSCHSESTLQCSKEL